MPAAFSFDAELWGDTPEMSWVFVSLPTDISDIIADAVPKRVGFGSVRVSVTVGQQQWKTSLFPSKTLGTYVLPVKGSIRSAVGATVGDTIALSLVVIDEGYEAI